MFEISATHPNLLELFNPEISNNPMLFSILLGHNPGHAFVDDANNPSKCMVSTNGALVFLSQHADQEFLDQGLAHIKQFSHVGIIWRADSFLLELPKADKIIQRLEFAGYNNTNAVTSAANSLPDGFEFRPIDQTLFEKCEWKEEIESSCSSLDNFLKHGFGFCLMNGDEIITETYAPFVGTTKAEIGVVTSEAHRGHGYAAMACTHLIQICQERGYQPYWSCDADNTASVNLARKLGFQNEHEYEIKMYRGTPK